MTQPTAQNDSSYHVFIACPQDMKEEREFARAKIEEHNVRLLQEWGVRLEVVTGSGVPAGGLGKRPQKYVIEETIKKHQKSLILFIGLMGSRLGTPTGKFPSGTLEEFEWVLKWAKKHKWPDIKFFFRDPPKPEADRLSRRLGEQWRQVNEFRERISGQIFPRSYSRGEFERMFTNDLSDWLSRKERTWKGRQSKTEPCPKEVGDSLRKRHRLFRGAELPKHCCYVEPTLQLDKKAIGRKQLLESLLRKEAIATPYVVISPPGGGKSLLLSKLQAETRERNPEALVILINLGIMSPKYLNVPRGKEGWPSNLIHEYLDDQEHSAVAKACFNKAAVYLFLDGLDEFALGNEEGTVELLRHCQELGQAGIRVTLACRAWYWLHGDRPLSFRIAELKEFNNDQALRFLGKRKHSLPPDAYEKDPETGKLKLKAWVLNPKVLSFIRDSQENFKTKTNVFANWVSETAAKELARANPRGWNVDGVLKFFGALAVFMTKKRVRAITRTHWQEFEQELEKERKSGGQPIPRLSFDDASTFAFVATTSSDKDARSGASTQDVREESLVFSHALVWEYFIAYQLTTDFGQLIEPGSRRALEELALAQTAIDYVPSSVYGFLSENLDVKYLDALLAWLRNPPVDLETLPPRLLFNVVEYIGKTGSDNAEAVEILRHMLENKRLDRIGVKGDPVTLVRYNVARALERLHPGAPQPYFDWSSDWGVASWKDWKGGLEEWHTLAIRGSKLRTRRAAATPRMDICFDQAQKGAQKNGRQQQDVCEVLLKILETSADPFLRVNCSHALIRWYDFADLALDRRLEELIERSRQSRGSCEEHVYANLCFWVRKAAWRLRWPEGDEHLQGGQH